MSYQWLHNEFFPHMCDSSIATWEAVILLAEKAPSCGWFWNQVFKNKGEFIKWDKVLECLQDYWDRLPTKERIVSVFQVSDKYELRSKEKLDASPPSIRTFISATVEHVFSSNRICLDQNEKFYRSNLMHASAVGRSKYNLGFDRFMRVLLEHTYGLALDFSKFDMKLFRRLFQDQIKFRWSCLSTRFRTAQMKMRLEELYAQMVCCFLVLVCGDVIFKTTGEDSGQGNTLPDNTMFNYRLLSYVFIKLWVKEYCKTGNYNDLMEEWKNNHIHVTTPVDAIAEQIFQSRSEVPSWVKFKSLVSPILCGDDNSMGVCESIHTWFNFSSIAEEFSLLGMAVTSTHDKYVRVQDLDFLSHTFICLPDYPNVYLPCPQTDKILCSLYHGNGSSDIRWILLRAFALRIESWANIECRNIIQEFIEFCFRTYKNQLVGSVPIPSTQGLTVEWRDVLMSYFTDEDLENLYYGFESESSLNLRFESAFQLIDTYTDITIILCQ